MAKTVIIKRALDQKLKNAIELYDAENASVDDLTSAIEVFLEVLQNIESQEAQGKTPTGKSTRIKDALPPTIAHARERIAELQAGDSVEVEVEEEVEDTSTPYEARVTQSHYDITLNEITTDPNLENDILDFAERLSDYVDTEDATAEFTIKFKGGSGSLKASASGYTITVNLPDTVTSQEIFEKIAPILVRFYDEMDSDYDADVDEFLMDI